jgi:hypothetical protein
MDGDLVPDHEENGSGWTYIPEGKPEEFGLAQDATFQQKAVWHRQEMFLEAFRRCGKIGKAAEASGLTRWAVIHWQRNDAFSFNRRLESAHEDYCEYWEQGMDERLGNSQGNRGSDILYMFKMKAEKPEKYRENVQVVGVEPVTQMLDRLTEIAAKRLERERQQLEAGAAEGEYREMGEEGQG